MTKRVTKEDDASELVKKPKVDVMRTTALIDVNRDCLYKIFQYMNFDELMTLADTNGHFIEGINLILTKINKRKTFTSTIAYWRYHHWWYFENFLIVPPHLFPYVGQSILNLFIDFKYVPEEFRSMLENHIMEQCTQLKELKLLNFRDGAFETIKEPFDKVEVLTISNGILGRRFSRFTKWFPQLRRLTLDCTVHDKSYIPENMAKMIPSLEFINLTLSEVIPKYCNRPKKSFQCKIDDVIESNRQLKGIGLNFGCANRDLRLVNKALKQLETLELRIMIKDFKRNNRKPIKFGSVKKLILEIGNETRNKLVDNINCVMGFDNLEELDITCFVFFEKWFFITNSINLKKLKLNFINLLAFLKLEQLLQISSTWPNLTDVTIPLSRLNPFEVFSFITSLHNLERLNVLRRSFHPYDLLQIEGLKTYITEEHEVLPGTEEFDYSVIRKT